ncbi:MAG: hypothetical protein AB8E15_01395 [Bdellovibrionales bacterium]
MTNPRTKILYSGIWGCKELKGSKKIASHDFANGNAGILLYTNRELLIRFCKKKYPDNPNNNLGDYIFNKKLDNLFFPNIEFKGQHGFGVPSRIIDHFIKDIQSGNITVSTQTKKKNRNMIQHENSSIDEFLIFDTNFQQRHNKRFSFIAPAFIAFKVTESSVDQIQKIYCLDVSMNHIRLLSESPLDIGAIFNISLDTNSEFGKIKQRVKIESKRSTEYIVKLIDPCQEWVSFINRLQILSKQNSLQKVG